MSQKGGLFLNAILYLYFWYLQFITISHPKKEIFAARNFTRFLRFLPFFAKVSAKEESKIKFSERFIFNKKGIRGNGGRELFCYVTGGGG